MVRSPVVDLDLDRLAVLEVGHLDAGPEGQPPVGGGERVLVKAFAARGFFAVEPGSVPGRLAHLGGARAGFEWRGGEGQGDRQHEGQEPGDHPARPAWLGMALLAFVHERTSSVGSWRPRTASNGGGRPELEKRHARSVSRFPRTLSRRTRGFAGSVSVN